LKSTPSDPCNIKYVAIFCPYITIPEGGPGCPIVAGQCELNKNLIRVLGCNSPDVLKQKSAFLDTWFSKKHLKRCSLQTLALCSLRSNISTPGQKVQNLAYQFHHIN